MAPLRSPDEPVRHKVLDLVGDFALLGAYPQCEVIAIKSGHKLHCTAVRELVGPRCARTLRVRPRPSRPRAIGSTSVVPIIDVREIMKILPHRYPLLLIDRITELEPMVLARGYKNVTANEPMFTGHFPGNPLLPGVYMIEALAQLGGTAICSPATWRARRRISPASTK